MDRRSRSRTSKTQAQDPQEDKREDPQRVPVSHPKGEKKKYLRNRTTSPKKNSRATVGEETIACVEDDECYESSAPIEQKMEWLAKSGASTAHSLDLDEDGDEIPLLVPIPSANDGQRKGLQKTSAKRRQLTSSTKSLQGKRKNYVLGKTPGQKKKKKKKK